RPRAHGCGGRRMGRDPRRGSRRRPRGRDRRTGQPARDGADGHARPHEVAAARGPRHDARPAPAQRGLRDGAVVAHRGLPRGIRCVPREARPEVRRKMPTTTRLAIDAGTSEAEAIDAVRAWVDANVPRAWVEAGRAGGAAAVRTVRTRDEY